MSIGRKIVVSIISVTVLIVLGFLSIGWFGSDLSYQSRIEVKASPEQCWAVLQNPGYLELWMESFDEIEFVSGIPGEIGSEYRLLFKEDAEMNALLQKLTVLDDNERLGFDIRNDFLFGSVDVQLSASENGTTITGTTDYAGQNAFLQSLFVLMNSSVDEADQKNYDNLLVLIESKSGN
jgi:hypothetical protein